MTWQAIDSGSFNQIYRNHNGKGDLVFKAIKERKKTLQIAPVDIMDNYARSVRIWNEINADLYPPAYISEITIRGKKTIGWVCPYVSGTPASDTEISQKLLDIFNKTGRIIVDAAARNNFIKTASGKIVCIDIGMAVQLDARDETCLLGLQRKPSFASLDTWQDMEDDYADWFLDPRLQHMQQTNQLVKALLFIKQHRPDITHADFLKSNPNDINLLAYAYDQEHPSSYAPNTTYEHIQNAVYQAEHLLIQKQDMSLEVFKHYCRERLNHLFTPPPSPRESPNHTAVDRDYALYLLERINQCQTVEEMDSVYGILHDIEQSNEEQEQLNDFAAIHQLNQALLQQITMNTELQQTKQNCINILVEFLEQHGNISDDELENIQTLSSHSPKEKIQYYKQQIANQKFSDQEKEILQLIKWIENSQSFDEIEEFILKYEESLPQPTAWSPLNIRSWLFGPKPEEVLIKDLTQILSKCKIIIETCKIIEKQKLEDGPLVIGIDNV